MATDGTDDGVLKRCFRFVGILLTSPDTSIEPAAVFQVIEPLFDGQRLLVVSYPVMAEEALGVAVATLDPGRLSSDAGHVLRPYLGKTELP